jgi:hypothetical protein
LQALRKSAAKFKKNAESAAQAKQIAERGQFHANDGETKMTSMLAAIIKSMRNPKSSGYYQYHR